MRCFLVSDKATETIIALLEIDENETITRAYVIPGREDQDAPIEASDLVNDDPDRFAEYVDLVVNGNGLVEVPPHTVKTFGLFE